MVDIGVYDLYYAKVKAWYKYRWCEIMLFSDLLQEPEDFSYLSDLLSNVYYEGKKLKRTKKGVKEEVLTSIY